MRNHTLDKSHLRRSMAIGFFGYLLLLLAGVLIVWGVLAAGPNSEVTSTSSDMPTMGTQPQSPVDVILHVLVTLATVIVFGAVFGHLCKFIGQPPVIGEVMAGLLLGPSFLGAVSPELMHCLIPSQVIDPSNAVSSSLKAIAQLGIILYMFLVGLELDATQLRRKGHSALAISHASIVVPFSTGTILSLWLYPNLSDPSVPFVSFALFLGVAMSITAFPVLARILTDRSLQNTPLGTVALSCAAADDVTAWCLLSFVVGVAKSETGNAAWVIGGAIGFILVMVFAIRPGVVRYVDWMERGRGNVPAYTIASVYAMILVASALTEWIGIHAIFGAFLLGVIIPSNSSLAKNFLSKLKEPVTILLLPAFFAYTGMRTEIGLLDNLHEWLLCLVIILVATLGKFGGTLVAARITGESWRDATVLGMLMNTRGLMELIVLNIGLDLGVISPTLFAMMVLMAIFTTIITSPAIQLLKPTISTS